MWAVESTKPPPRRVGPRHDAQQKGLNCDTGCRVASEYATGSLIFNDGNAANVDNVNEPLLVCIVWKIHSQACFWYSFRRIVHARLWRRRDQYRHNIRRRFSDVIGRNFGRRHQPARQETQDRNAGDRGKVRLTYLTGNWDKSNKIRAHCTINYI